jgi:ABC-type uncharacterized transport system substrate-binding protein
MAMLGKMLILTMSFLGLGCVQSQLQVSPIPESVHQSNVVPLPPAPEPGATVKKIPALQVAILVSENLPAYSGVANDLTKLLGRRGSIHYLTSSQLENQKIISRLSSENNLQVVAIGLAASVAAKSIGNKQVIFCQVYNYQHSGLLTPKRKGVSMLPSLNKSFTIWHELAPDIRDIGVIIGPGLKEMIHAAEDAAYASGIKLHVVTVNTDKEYLYAYKKLSKKVQGFWLLPDNRILSEKILRDIMTFSVRNSKQVAVFSDELLKLGGLFSFSSDTMDIAQQVVTRLEQSQFKEDVPGPDMTYLVKVNLRINLVMANKLNLKIPASYNKYAKAP